MENNTNNPSVTNKNNYKNHQILVFAVLKFYLLYYTKGTFIIHYAAFVVVAIIFSNSY